MRGNYPDKDTLLRTKILKVQNFLLKKFQTDSEDIQEENFKEVKIWKISR